MSAISSDEIISILKEEIKNYDVISRDQEVGTVISVGDGIASVYGIDHAMYGEIVTLETGLKGMVQDIRKTRSVVSCSEMIQRSNRAQKCAVQVKKQVFR